MIIVAAPGGAEFNALRALAQLAANIVDYIDNDDISTPFVWNPINPHSILRTVDELRRAQATN